MKKIMIMLAFCGAFAIVPAQTYQSGSMGTGTNNPSTQQEDRSTSGGKNYNDKSGSQEPGAQQPGTTQSDKAKSGKTYNMGDQKAGSQGDRMSGGGMEKNGAKTRHHSTSKGAGKDMNAKDMEHMSGDKMKQGEHKVGVKTKKEMNESKSHAGKHVKSGEKSGMSTVTYTHTPVESDKTAVGVPEKVRTAFSNAYSSSKATWKKEGETFRAMFKSGKDKDALETIVVYDKNGNVIVTERELKNTECPDAIEKYCHRDNRIWKVEAKDGTNKYLIQDDKTNKWFDASGNRIYGASEEHGLVHHRSASYTK